MHDCASLVDGELPLRVIRRTADPGARLFLMEAMVSDARTGPRCRTSTCWYCSPESNARGRSTSPRSRRGLCAAAGAGYRGRHLDHRGSRGL